MSFSVYVAWTSVFKPWPNGLASRRKLKTLVYLRLRLARTCVYLRWLAMTCAHFGRDQICTQVKASFLPFGHPTQVNARWVTSINLLLANEIQDMSALKWVFCNLRVLVRRLASAFAHSTEVSTQVQLAPTCDYLPVRLTRALDLYINLKIKISTKRPVWRCTVTLSLNLKVERDTHVRNSKGTLFHMVGAATVKERPLYVLRLNLVQQEDYD